MINSSQQWFDVALQLTRVHRWLARVLQELADLSSEVLALRHWKGKVMATFDEISAKLDAVLANQDAATTLATEIRDDIDDLKTLIANQNTGGLSEGQANAIAAKLDEISGKATSLQTTLSETAALHTPEPVVPPVEPPAPIE